MRTLLRAMAVMVVLLALPALRAQASPAGQATSPISAAEAAPFIGEWTLALQGPNGPGNFTLSLSAEKEKVTGEIESEALGKQPITAMRRAEKSLVLDYSFTWEGSPVDASVSLTPGDDGKTAARIDFAGGAYVMTGSATKKEKSK